MSDFVIPWDFTSPVYDNLICNDDENNNGQNNDISKQKINLGPYTLKPYCVNCQQSPHSNNNNISTLSLCSRCRRVYYCSRECQKRHFPEHKKECKEAKNLDTTCQRERQLLIDNSGDDMDPFGSPEDPFTNSVGMFWGLFDTRDFMRASSAACKMDFYFAKKYNMRQTWEIHLNSSLEMLRLCMRDNMGVRYGVPFLLLVANRDDDAYSFCKYWILQHDDEEDIEEKHANSEEGEWIYERKENMRFERLDEEFFEKVRFGTPFALGICLVKLRLMDCMSKLSKRMDKVVESTGLQSQGGVGSVVASFLIPKFDYEKEYQTVQRLLDIIHQGNPTVLPAILNPGPLFNQESPRYIAHGKPSEAYSIVQDALIAGFDTNDKARSILIERFGTDCPTYPHQMETYNF